MANESVNHWKIKKTKGFIFKLDIEKVFNKLSCDFIEYILEKQKDTQQNGEDGLVRASRKSTSQF